MDNHRTYRQNERWNVQSSKEKTRIRYVERKRNAHTGILYDKKAIISITNAKEKETKQMR